jgi:tetratricopeptide (TPR) repeat protein
VQALTIGREMGDRLREGYALHNLGKAYAELGEAQRAVAYCESACVIARTIGEQRLEGYAQSYLAHALVQQGEGARAIAAIEQALALLRAVDDRWGESECSWQFGLALAQQGDRGRALPLLRATVGYEQEIGHIQAAEHAALLVRLEAGEALPPELCASTLSDRTFPEAA